MPVPEDYRQWNDSEIAEARASKNRHTMVAAARGQLCWLRNKPTNLHFLRVPGILESDLSCSGDFRTDFGRYFVALAHALTPTMLDEYDLIYCMHWDDPVPDLLAKTSRPLVLHYGGQAFRSVIQRLCDTGILSHPQVKVVSYSQMEQRRFAEYINAVTVIPFGKDPEDYGGYRGESESILVVNNNLYSRSESSPWLLRNAVQGFPYYLAGAGNAGGYCLTYQELIQAMRTHAVCLHLGVRQVPYTLALIECMLIGIPVVSLRYGDIDNIIEHGVSGFIGNTPIELNRFVNGLMQSSRQRIEMGEAGRQRAQKLFHIDEVSSKWDDLFDAAVRQ